MLTPTGRWEFTAGRRGEKQLSPIPARQNGKRGRVAKSDAHNLWERFKPDLRFDADRTAEIAHVLHYADASAFTRTFRR